MNHEKALTLAEVKKRIKGLDSKQAKSVVCALVGHSLIVTHCFGYVYCGRCDAEIADKLGGYGYADAPKCVQIGHNCPTCRDNYKALGWKDKFLAPDPFTEETAEVSR